MGVGSLRGSKMRLEETPHREKESERRDNGSNNKSNKKWTKTKIYTLGSEEPCKLVLFKGWWCQLLSLRPPTRVEHTLVTSFSVFKPAVGKPCVKNIFNNNNNLLSLL